MRASNKTSEGVPLTPRRWAMLSAFAASAVFMIALDGASRVGEPLFAGPFLEIGALAWLMAAYLIVRDNDPRLRRRMFVLLGCIGILAWCDISTSLDKANFLRVGIPFALVVLLPPLVFMQSGDAGVIRFSLDLNPRHWRKLDLFYTAVSIPLAWAVLEFYWWLNPDLYRQWSLPEEIGQAAVNRLFIGINLVGIWDELFFINTVLATLRSLFPYRIANAVQAVIYTSVLFDMAFIGIGPVLVFAFAWTQGSMFERSGNLLFVLLVHLIVDFFLVAAIVGSHAPGTGLDYLWLHGAGSS